LVMHVRKLDKRVKQNRERLEQKRKEQLQKAADQQKRDIKRNLENIGDYEIDEEVRLEHLKKLEEIENALDAEFGTVEDAVDDGSENGSDEENSSHCIVCEKSFKTVMAYNNHIKSRKHKVMLETLRKHMKDDDQLLFGNDCSDLEIDTLAEAQAQQAPASKKKKKRKNNKEDDENVIEGSEAPVASEVIDALSESIDEVKFKTEDKIEAETFSENLKGKSGKEKSKKKNPIAATKNEGKTLKGDVDKASAPTAPVPSTCQKCGASFESKTKLFNHLRETGHATLKTAVDVSEVSKKGKKGKNKK